MGWNSTPPCLSALAGHHGRVKSGAPRGPLVWDHPQFQKTNRRPSVCDASSPYIASAACLLVDVTVFSVGRQGVLVVSCRAPHGESTPTSDIK